MERHSLYETWPAPHVPTWDSYYSDLADAATFEYEVRMLAGRRHGLLEGELNGDGREPADAGYMAMRRTRYANDCAVADLRLYPELSSEPYKPLTETDRLLVRAIARYGPVAVGLPDPGERDQRRTPKSREPVETPRTTVPVAIPPHVIDAVGRSGAADAPTRTSTSQEPMNLARTTTPVAIPSHVLEDIAARLRKTG